MIQKDFSQRDAEYARIENIIASDDSPVGIDAKHTHVLILRLLYDINERLSVLESKLGPDPAR